jgi:ubiquinone/menaquinone biosynthesis C-methylase UbiE
MSNYDENSESQTYWNEEGGNKWAENIEIVESMIEPLSGLLIQEIAAQNGENVLDVGSGGGVTSIKLAEQVGSSGSVLGVDVSEPILSVARNRGKDIVNLEFQQSDAATAVLDENSFDIITSRFGVMFFDDPVQAFKNLHGALKPSGRLVFLCWRALEENPWIAAPAKAALEIVPPPADAERPDPTAPGPFSLADEDHLKSILSAAGFNNIELQAMDTNLSMGVLSDAVGFLMKMGPAAEVIKEATEDEKNAVAKAMTKTLGNYETADGIKIPSASWIVKAAK